MFLNIKKTSTSHILEFESTSVNLHIGFLWLWYLTGTSWGSPGTSACEQMRQEQNDHQDEWGPEGLGRRGGAPCSSYQGSLCPPVQTHAGRAPGWESCKTSGVAYMRCGNRRRWWQSESRTPAPVFAPEVSTAWRQKRPPGWSPGCHQMDPGPSQLLSQLSRSRQAPGFLHTAAERWNSEPWCQKTTNPWGPPHLQTQELNHSVYLQLLKGQKRKVATFKGKQQRFEVDADADIFVGICFYFYSLSVLLQNIFEHLASTKLMWHNNSGHCNRLTADNKTVTNSDIWHIY